MRIALASLLVTLVCSGGALAAEESCKARSAEKKLAGAAMTSFMKKCEADAEKACDTSAAGKKLAGAAKASFTKKCVHDAIGT